MAPKRPTRTDQDARGSVPKKAKVSAPNEKIVNGKGKKSSSKNKTNNMRLRVEKQDNISMKKTKKILKLPSKTLNYSLCIPTTIIDNCSNLEQITHVLYQVAKSATLFNAGEIVILDLGDRRSVEGSEKRLSTSSKKDIFGIPPQNKKIKFNDDTISEDKKVPKDKQHRKKLSRAILIATLLQYFVTPPYLVSSVFKKQYTGYFKAAAKLPRLSALPFMRHLADDKGRYREGLAIPMTKPGKKATNLKKKPYLQTKYINIGKAANLELRGQIVPINVRVTVDTIERKVVSPDEAYGDFVGAKASYGYHVRVAKTLADVFTHSGFSDGYTQCLWINSGDFHYDENSQRSIKVETKIPHVEKILKPSIEELQESTAGSNLPHPANLLLVFGKWPHIQRKFEESKHLFNGADGAHNFFDGQLDLPGATPHGNICIEDGCMIALSTLATL